MDETLRQIRTLRHPDASRVAELIPEPDRTQRLQTIVVLPRTAQPDRASSAGRRRMLVVTPLAGAIVTAIAILILTGIVPGDGPTAATPAQAAVVSGALRVLRSGPGTILIESDTYFSRQPGGHQWTQRQDVIYQTPKGLGAQNFLTSEGPGSTETSTINGVTEDWDPTTNTIYTNVGLNPCGCRITRATTPGRYRVSMLPTPHALRGTGAWEMNHHLPAPLTISARAARALRRGAAQLTVEPSGATGHRGSVMKITAAFRVSSDTSQIQSALAQHHLILRGRTTVAGRAALELQTPAGTLSDGYLRYYVDPRTYAPIRTVSRSGGDLSIITFHRYQVLPDTAAGRLLLDLRHRHPGARIDTSHADYLRAMTQLSADSRRP